MSSREHPAYVSSIAKAGSIPGNHLKYQHPKCPPVYWLAVALQKMINVSDWFLDVAYTHGVGLAGGRKHKPAVSSCTKLAVLPALQACIVKSSMMLVMFT